MKLREITLIIDLGHGGRVILGLDRRGRLHSGAFNRNVPAPMVHDGHYRVPRREVNRIWEAAAEAFSGATGPSPALTFAALDEGTWYHLDLIYDRGERHVEVVPPAEVARQGLTVDSVPPPLQAFLRLVWDQNRW